MTGSAILVECEFQDNGKYDSSTSAEWKHRNLKSQDLLRNTALLKALIKRGRVGRHTTVICVADPTRHGVALEQLADLATCTRQSWIVNSRKDSS